MSQANTYIRGEYSLRRAENKKAFREGMHDGIPIGLGYLAVAFSLGIAAKHAGVTPFQGFVVSFLCNASAGEYAGFTVIAAQAAFVEMAIMTLIANARYLLMSCAMSQRVKPGTPLIHRLIMAYDITDELFAIAIARPGYLNPNYSYGAIVIATPCWAMGTALGCLAGNLMPDRLVSAFSVALYGMFLAIIIPPARKSKVVAVVVVCGFLFSYLSSVLPVVSTISGGTRTIILTVLIAGAAALLFPKTSEDEERTEDVAA